jgi:NAD(P)-dependent dehydrogenase (short-subunit alcohol dehydrogenase family)
MDLEGKRTIVTGASSGIGAELARQLAAAGARLVLSARRADRLEAVAAECRARGAQAAVVAADLAAADGCQELVERAVAELGGLDLVVLNAGVSDHTPVAEVKDPSLFVRVMTTNYFGPAFVTYHALPHLRRSRGAVAVVSSLQGKTGFPGFAAYAASKHALHGFFDSLRTEVDDLQVTLVCPGPVVSEIDDGRPSGAPGLMSTARCAELILEAIADGRREAILTAAGRLGAWVRPFFPSLVDRIVRRKVKDFFHS